MNEPFDILVDARALQDPAYAERGIGRLTANLIAHAREALPELDALSLIGLVDPALPPLSPRHRTLFGALRRTAYTGTMRRPAWFVEPSPMTHDPLFVAPLLAHPAIACAAVVYDFIPFDEPERYLARAATRVEYHVALAWLARYSLFLPISAASAERLVALVGAEDADLAVIGAPLDPAFERAAGASGARHHVLVAGGADPRKNVACALRAHGASAALRAAGIPIVVTGHYPPAAAAALAALHAAAGGAPGLLRFTGHVPDPDLARLYQQSLAVIAPSRAEGFSLPVIEAMAAGAPVFASAIPAHRELIADAGLLFAPDDDAALRRLLERALAEPEFVAAISAVEARVWPRFRAGVVAKRFWRAVADRAGARPRPVAPAVVTGRRPRVALLTPLPPARSGCADYSAASVAELGRRVELHLFTATPRPLPIAGAASLRPLSALPLVSGSFDRVVGVMGNSDFHLDIFHLLLRHGGAAICHDARLLGFYRILLGAKRAQSVASAELGRPVSIEEIDCWLTDESALPTLFLGELAGATEPLIFHSSVTARLAAERYRIPERSLPFALYRPWRAAALTSAAHAAARARLGLAPEEIVLASFGYVHETKCPEECIWALEMLRGWGLSARLVFVGAVQGDGAAVHSLVRRLGLAQWVRVLDGYLGEPAYRDWLLAADLGLQFRSFGFGSISGALADCIAAGLPTVANAELAETMQAPSYVRRIPDPVSPVLLANAAADLLGERVPQAGLLAECEDYALRHSFSVYAERLCGLLGLEPEPGRRAA